MMFGGWAILASITLPLTRQIDPAHARGRDLNGAVADPILSSGKPHETEKAAAVSDRAPKLVRSRFDRHGFTVKLPVAHHASRHRVSLRQCWRDERTNRRRALMISPQNPTR